MKLFKKKRKNHNRPSWEEIVAMMYGKELNYSDDYEIIDVIYSADKAHRYVILKSNANYLTYKFEVLQMLDEEELSYCPADTLPAYWSPSDNTAQPIFDDIDVLMKELKSEPQYMTYFDKN